MSSLLPKSLSSTTKIGLTVAQFITLVASLLGGAGSIGFVVGNLLPRVEQVETQTRDLQILQAKLGLTMERLSAIVEMDHEILKHVSHHSPPQSP